MIPPLATLGIRRLHLASAAVPVEHTAAHELALLTGAKIAVGPRPSGPGVTVALASRRWAKKLPSAAAKRPGWMWLRIADGAGEITADEPALLFAAVRLLGNTEGILIDHAGDALEPALGDAARATMAACPHYRWLGGRPYEATRRRIQAAHVLVHASRAEGGAHVVMEAICSGTPVLASRIDGNVGLLGEDYGGLFEAGDGQALADLLLACQAPRTGLDLVAHLRHQCTLRAPLFEPSAERAALHRWVQDLWTH